MQEMVPIFDKVDLYIDGNDLLITNLTGHPMVCVPNGFSERRGVKRPTAITFTGKLYGETELLAVASAYQEATGHHLQRPPMEYKATVRRPMRLRRASLTRRPSIKNPLPRINEYLTHHCHGIVTRQ